jgi:hypothetical protein
MGIIRLAFISLIVFFLIFTGISLFIPSHIRISKAIDISASSDSVLNHLNNVANWKKWYPGADTAEFFMAEGKIQGILTGDLKGIIIINSTDSSVTTANAGPNSKRGESGWNIYEGRIPNTVTVQWFMDFHLQWYPWEKFSSLLLEKRYGAIMEQGLDKLKEIMEK